MIQLAESPNYTNSLGLVLTMETIIDLSMMIIDLHQGKSIDLFDTFGENVINLKGFHVERDDYNNIEYEYLIAEVPCTNSQDFPFLREYMLDKLPTLYKEQLSYGISKENFMYLFSRKSLLLFSFIDGKLKSISSLPSTNSFADYFQNTIIQENLFSNVVKQSISMLEKTFNSGVIKVSLFNNRYTYHSNASILSLHVLPDYLRLNSYEFNKDEFSLLMERNAVNLTYKAAESYSKIFTLLLNSTSSTLTDQDKSYFGRSILSINRHNYPMSVYTNKIDQVYPILIEPSVVAPETAWVRLTLSNLDKEFLEEVEKVEEDTAYNKHKRLLTQNDTTSVRGCKLLTNNSKSIGILVREGKKKLSDEEAYKNRIFRDYLSHAISLVAIPLFQKEFVIPEFLQASFTFKMASLDSFWCFINHNSNRKPRKYDNYFKVFEKTSVDEIIPFIPKELAASQALVKTFISSLKNKTLTSTTQARCSIFTRHFISPLVETISRYSFGHPKTTPLYGWMYGCDDQSQISWIRTVTSSHLLRSAPVYGRYHANCGLVSDKTFGIKSILTHVFTKPSFIGGLETNVGIFRAEEYVDVSKKAAFISAILEIHGANFIPNDAVENAIKSYGQVDFGQELTRLNQLLFLSEDSLNIFKALYSCESYETLAACLEFCMPKCLEILASLDYSQELKDHVSSMLTYFWNTTKLISEELTNDTTKE